MAVVGAVFSSVYGPHLARLLHRRLPAPALATVRELSRGHPSDSGGAAPNAHAPIIGAANRAFVDGLSRGSLVRAAVVALGAMLAFLVLPRRIPGALISSRPRHLTAIGQATHFDQVRQRLNRWKREHSSPCFSPACSRAAN